MIKKGKSLARYSKTLLCTDGTNGSVMIQAPLFEKFKTTLQALDVEIIINVNKDPTPIADDVLKICLSAHLDPSFFHSYLNKNDIVVNVEPTYAQKNLQKTHTKIRKYFKLARYCNVLEFNIKSVPLWKNYRLFHVPPFDIGDDKGEKPMDVLFVGHLQGDRKEFLLELNQHFQLNAIMNVYGQKLYQMIHQAKIFLGICYIENIGFDYFRFALCGLSNTLFVAEMRDMESSPEMQPLVGLTLFPYREGMVEGIRALLDNPERYQKALAIQNNIAKKFDDEFQTLLQDILTNGFVPENR